MYCFPNLAIKCFHFTVRTMDPKDINIYLNLKGEKRMQLNQITVVMKVLVYFYLQPIPPNILSSQ